MPHVPGHTTNQPPSGYQQVFEDGRYKQVLPSDKPSARKSNASFINELTNLFKKSLQSQLQSNQNLFDAYRIADQELDALSFTNFIPGGQSTFGLPYSNPNREPILKSAFSNIFQKMMEGLAMQSGAPGMIEQQASPSLPNRNPYFDLGPPPIMSPQQFANFAQMSDPLGMSGPGRQPVQKTKQIQPRPQTYTPGM